MWYLSLTEIRAGFDRFTLNLSCRTVNCLTAFCSHFNCIFFYNIRYQQEGNYFIYTNDTNCRLRLCFNLITRFTQDLNRFNALMKGVALFFKKGGSIYCLYWEELTLTVMYLGKLVIITINKQILIATLSH